MLAHAPYASTLMISMCWTKSKSKLPEPVPLPDPMCRGCDDRDRALAFEVDLPVDVLTDVWETHVDGFHRHCGDGVV